MDHIGQIAWTQLRRALIVMIEGTTRRLPDSFYPRKRLVIAVAVDGAEGGETKIRGGACARLRGPE
jgi:hypothetical protein